MGQAKLYGQNKGSMSINGIIKNYYAYAGENISAGDLVEYVNGVAGKTELGTSEDTIINNTTTYTSYAVSAVVLDENRVFIAHSYGSNYYLYGIVCMINGNTITCGTDTELSSIPHSGSTISVKLLPNGNVFIAHRYSTSYTLYGMVVSIDGTTITKRVGDTTLVNATDAGFQISTELLSNGTIFIAHSYGSDRYLYATVVTINDTTISTGTDTAIISSKRAGQVISSCLLKNEHIFIFHSYNSSNYYLYGIVCSVSGTTVSIVHNNTALSTASQQNCYEQSPVLLPNGNVFISHSYDSTTHLGAIVCSISNEGITVGTDTLLSDEAYMAYDTSSLVLPNNKVIIAHTYSHNTQYLQAMIVSINELAITVETDTTLNTGAYTGLNVEMLLLSNGTIFMAHNYSSDYHLYAQIWGIDYENNVPTNQISIAEYETQVRKVTTGQFDGIAKTSGEGGDDTGHKDIVSIWTKPQEVVYEGNIFPTSGWNEEVSKLKYSTDSGYVIEADSVADIGTDDFQSYRACDGSLDSYWYSGKSKIHWVKITCPEPTKITKMASSINLSSADKIAIQGSKDGDVWVDLGTPEFSATVDIISSETTLSNPDYYKYYRIYSDSTNATGQVSIEVHEWQTSEYIVLE